MADGLARLVVGRDPARTLVRVVVLVAAAALVITYGILPVRGQGPSMQPTIGDGQLLIVSRLSFRLRTPRRGEVVAVRLAGQEAVLIKRILAGPGDAIAIDDGQVVVNDVAIDEPYVEFRQPWRMDQVTLGDGQYFVVGDNRGMPMALHTMGTVDGSDPIGQVAALGRLRAQLADDVVVSTGRGAEIRGRDAVAGLWQRVRASGDAVRVRVLDLAVAVAADGASATADGVAELSLERNGVPERELHEVRATFVAAGSEWRLQQAALVEAVTPP
jgi:signal peptidase I